MDENKINIDLITRCLNNTATPGEKQELLHWINLDKENEQYYFTLKDLSDASRWESLKAEAETGRNWDRLKSKLSPAGKSPRRIFISQWMKYAAVLVAGVLISALFMLPKRSGNISPENKNQVITGIGERTQVVLPDGTLVWVNSCSSVSYFHDYGTNSRNVFLKGEAYFKVVHNGKLPFKVLANGVEVQALGTSFNVSAYENDRDISAVLLEGAISFKQEQAGISQVLKPGERITWSLDSNKTTVDKVNADTYVAWSTGETRFEHLKMEEIAKRLQRIYHITFVIENEKIRNMRFTGTFRKYESLDQILDVIKTNTNLNIKMVRDTVFMK